MNQNENILKISFYLVIYITDVIKSGNDVYSYKYIYIYTYICVCIHYVTRMNLDVFVALQACAVYPQNRGVGVVLCLFFW